MKTMIQIAILVAILAPSTTFGNPHAVRPAAHPSGVIIPAPKPRPTPKPYPRPAPKPSPTPTPTPYPVYRKHHHHRPAPVVYVVAAGYSPASSVVQQTTYNTQARPEASAERTLTPREFLQAPDLYRGQRVAVYGKVTQSVRGMCGVDYFILDGVLRCEFPRDARYIRGAYAETNRYVTIVGTAVGGWHATASADLAECDRPF